MDLSKVTREELEREATQRGVRDVAQLTRAQLIRAIEAPSPGGAIDTAKALFRGVLGVARTLRGRPSSPPPPPRSTQVESTRSATGGPPPGQSDSVRASSTSAASAAPAATPPQRMSGDTQRMRVSETPAGLPAIVRAATDTPPSEHPPAPRAVPEPRPTSARAEPTRKLKLPPVEDSDTDAGPGTAEDTLVEATAEDVDTASDASASDASASDAGDHDGAIGQPPLEALPPLPPLARDVTTTLDLGPLRGEILLVQPDALEHQRAAHRRETATTVPIRVPRVRDSDEPIPTRTMARLLHEQGHHRRALAILQNLLAQRPGDRELQADLEAVGRSLGLAHTPAAPLNPGARAQPSPRAELVSMLLPGSRVLLAWGLSDESLASAKSLGARGTLVARVLVHAPGESGAVARSLTDKDVSAAGEWAIGPIASGSFVTAAVGFRDGEQFVSVAAAPVLDIA